MADRSAPRYLDWLRTLPCAVDGCHELQAEPHHLKGDMGASGVALKAPDLLAMPVCRAHHDHIQQARPGWREMQRQALAWTLVRAVGRGYVVLNGEEAEH